MGKTILGKIMCGGHWTLLAEMEMYMRSQNTCMLRFYNKEFMNIVKLNINNKD